MTGPTHILFGVTTGIVLCKTLGLGLDPLGLLCLFLGALGPDIDADSGSITKPGKLFSGFLPWRFARVLDELGTVVSRIATTFTGHRGFFHTPILGILLLLLAWYLNMPRFGWFAIGYLSHLLADACTVRGIPMFWPLKKEDVSIAPVRVGSLTEFVVAIGLGLFIVTIGWDLLPERTRQGFAEIKESINARREKSETRGR